MPDKDPLQSFNELHRLTVPRLLHLRAQQHGNRLAVSAPAAGGGRERLSYAQLVQRMEAMGRALYRLGLAPGDRVALFLSNHAMREALLTALGCWRIGAIVVPLNVRAADDELRHAMELTEARCVVAMMADVPRLRGLARTAKLLCIDGQGEGAWPDPMQLGAAGDLQDCVQPEDPSVLLFTSGTTARSKAVTHCHRSQLHCGFAIAGALGLTGEDHYQGSFPLYTSSVLNLACMGAWVAGATLVFEPPALDNAARLRLMESEACTVYHGVPTLLHFMVDEYARDAGAYELSRLRRICYGGALMPAEVIAKLRQALPRADQVHIWGMTETGPAGTALPPWFLPRKAGCIGAPMPGSAVRVVDEQARAVAVGEVGEILFSGPSAALGYWRNPQATAETFVDGWVRTGDVGRLDEEGHLHFVDRKKDIINRGGQKIASAAVEDVLYRFAGVAEAAVVAVPHPALGEDVAACVVAAPGAALDIEALRAHCARHLANYAVPRRWQLMEALPKNPMGKILKRELRELFH